MSSERSRPASASDPRDGTPAPPTPVTLRVATAVVVIEAVLVVGYVAVLGYLAVDGRGDWRIVGYLSLYALAFAGLSLALIHRRRWVRAPLIVLQMLLVASGVATLNAGFPVPGVLLVAGAGAGIATLLAPTTRTALGVR